MGLLPSHANGPLLDRHNGFFDEGVFNSFKKVKLIFFVRHPFPHHGFENPLPWFLLLKAEKGLTRVAAPAMPSVEEILDEFDDEEEEQLGFSWNYLTICLLLPALNGLLNGYAWSGLALHYLDMGWPIARAGWPHSVGFICRLVAQQIQLRCGFWVMIPFCCTPRRSGQL